jgi:uncharacterized protein (TIGR03437 family)
VTIGGVQAAVAYAGPAPGQVAGLVQINAVIPDTVPTGPAVPLTISVDSISSATGVTIAIR